MINDANISIGKGHAYMYTCEKCQGFFWVMEVDSDKVELCPFCGIMFDKGKEVGE